MATSHRCLLFVFLLSHGFLVSPTRAAADCTNLLADIVFIMDASGSVKAPNFSTMKSFLVSFVQTIQSHISPNSVRIAVIRYASSASTMFYLQDHLFPSGLITAINSISYTGGGTSTHSALNLAQSVLSSNGARTGVTKLAVLLTDGKSNHPSDTQTAASSLRAAGVRIMAIGVGNVDFSELQGVATSSSYVHTVNDFSALASIQQQLVSIACEPVCSWHQDHCWPGDCSQMLAANCVCRAGFSRTSGTAKRCQLSQAPDLLTCRLTLKDSHGNEVRSRTSSTLQHCNNQQHEFMNIQPSSVVYDLKADLHLAVGSYPYYVSSSSVGVVGFKLKVTKVSISGVETKVTEVTLNQMPTCTESVSSTSPTTLLDCSNNLGFSSSALADGERLCVDMEALGGGFYRLQDFTPSPQGTETFPTVSSHRRICFNYDSTKPAHCSQTGSCSRSPLQLSNRLTRSPDIRVAVDQWLDPIPQGGNAGHASQVSEYILEVHGVDVASTFLSVQENALIRTRLTGSAPYDVPVTLPTAEPRLYAVLLEVHDVAGNVGYARRLVLYDNSSRIALDPHRSLVVVSANPAVGHRWQTVVGDVCLDWRDRFYNDVFFHYDFMLPVKADTGRGIQGQYDQISGVLPVSGTPTTRGVVKFEVSWSLNSGAPSSWQSVANVPAQNVCLPLPLKDGDTYDLTIRASDIMNNTNTDDVRVHVDHTAPVVRELGLRGRWGRTGLYVHDSTDLSTMELVLEGSDPHSGLSSILWSLGTQPFGDDVGRRAAGVQRLDNVTSCGTLSHCYCPVVGQCETFLYNLTFTSLMASNTHEGDHHRDYYITVNFTNNAELILTTPVQILIDVSPPTGGVALEGVSDNDAAEMDFTSLDEVHVRWHGFADHESGLLLYRVVLASRCLTDREMDEANNATEVTSGTSTSFKFPSEGRYFTSVVAYNGALTPSPVACSDGVVFDTTAPRLLNVSIAHARALRSIACTTHPRDTSWLVNTNLTRTQLANTTACFSVCRRANATMVSLDHLAVTTAFTMGEQESDELCRSLPRMSEDSWIVLPSDRLMVTWASEDAESEMEDFHVGAGSSRTSASSPDLIPLVSTHAHHSFHRHHSGLGQGAIFYLFLQATSKANLQTLLTMGPILVDSTPPRVTATLTAEVDGDHLAVSWEKGVVVDLEQPRDIEFEYTFRVASDIAGCRLKNSSIAGCLRYPISSLHEHDARAGRAFFFQLHVLNAAGHVTSVNTSSVHLPARVSHGVVVDILPSAVVNTQLAASEVVKDVDVIVEPSVVCVAWSDLRLRSGHGDIQVQIGIGSSIASDDVIAFSPADVTVGRACVNVTSLPPYTRLYSLVKATVSDSSAVFSSDGFVSVPSDDSANTIRVFNGKGCSSKDMVGSDTLAPHSASFNLTADVPLHPGDLLYVSFDPFIPGVRFQNAVVVLETLTGYQVVLGSSSLSAVMPTPTTRNTSVGVHNCLKEQSIIFDEEEMVSTWDVQGPWTRLSTFVSVELLDRTCLQRTPTAQLDQNDTRRCLVAETRTSPHFRTNAFKSLTRLHGHYYVSSVAVCFDNQCLPPVFSDDVYATSGKPALRIDDAVLLSQTSSEFEIAVNASGQPSLAHRPCVFLWSVARAKDASHLLSDWRLRTESRGCSSLQIRELFAFLGSGHGSLYACLRLIFPRQSPTPTCKLITRMARANQIQPFHVIEMSQTTLRETDFDVYLHSQQLGSKLHDLYDLDLDFVTSDLLLAALVTNSFGREVRWFLMTEARLPAGDSCAGDTDCITSSVSDNGKVVFPRQNSDFQHGVMYYVCALISPRGLDPKNHTLAGYNDFYRVCGDGFVVDDESPVGGTVAITNADSGYLADGGRVMVTWEGFSDVERDVTHLPDNTTLTYSVALGSSPGAEDLASLTKVGHRTAWTFHNLHVTSGIFCYATVRAKDRVGHVTDVTSDAVVLDNTPPDEGLVIVGSFMEHNFLPGHMLHVRWEGITDSQSGVASQSVAVSMRGGHDDVISFTRVQGSSVTINGSYDLVDGHSYVVLLKSTNRAGLSTLTSSESFIVDSSPPVLGSVWNGSPNNNEHLSYLTDLDTYSVQWSGFHDPHSDVAFYRVGLGTSPGVDNVVPVHYVGLRTAYTWQRQFDQGRQYFAIVEACNHAGLCSVMSSSGLVFDNSPPTSGHVVVGTDGRHSGFYGHNTTLQAEWIGFNDPQSGIREFLWCVGTQPGTCDVKPFSTSLQARSFTGVVTSLPSATPLYLSVRAFNFAGLTTDGASESFLVDTTPPVPVMLPTFSRAHRGSAVHSQYDRSLLHVAWSFQDLDSLIASYTISIRGQRQGRQGLEPVTVATDDHVTVQLGPEDLLMDGDLYRATVVACNSAGLCSTATSDSLLVDSTPPVVGKFLALMPWRTTFSNGSTETTVNVTWTGFTDEESQVERYHFTAGKTYGDTDISEGFLVVPHDNTSDFQNFTLSFNESLSAGDLLVLSVWAENSLGLYSTLQRMTFEVYLDSAVGDSGSLQLQRHSCTPHYCTNECTCAPTGQVCHPNAPSTCTELPANHPALADISIAPFLGCAANKLNFISSASCLEGFWVVTSQNSTSTISRFEYSFSLSNQLPGMGVFDPQSEPVWHDSGLRTSAVYCLPAQRTLLPGSSYMLHVRAWLTRDSYVTVTSLPIVADHSPPSRRRGRSVTESDSSCSGDLDFVMQQASVTSCWTGVFSDAQSGIDYYEVWVGTTPYADNYQTLKTVGKNTSMDLDVSSMTEGTRYYVSVRAWNGAGLSTTLVSDGLVRDNTPPLPGSVFLSSRHASDHVTDDATTLSASWHGFEDLESGVASYSLALFDVADLSTPVVDFVAVGFRTEHVFQGLSLQHRHSYKMAVKAHDAAGMQSSPSFSAAMLVDVTPPEGVTCTQFQLERETSLLYTRTLSFRHETYNASMDVDVPARNHLLKLVVRAVALNALARGELTLDPHLRMPLSFRFDRSSNGVAEHVFLAPSGGQTRLSVEVRADAGANITAQIFSCATSSSSSTHAVTIRQVSASAVSICTTIVDEESDVMSLFVGVGSTPGGLQVQPLMPLGQGGHVEVEVSAQQGTPLYATVLAENHAETWSRFISQPVVMDTTPPVIDRLNITVTYAAVSSGINVTSATAIAKWTVLDAENGSVSCTCELAGHDTIDDVIQALNNVRTGECQWRLDQPRHGARVRAVVSCMNAVQISATETSSDATVLVNAPDISKAVLHFLSNLGHFSPYDQPGPLVRSGQADLEVTWSGAGDATVDHFQYRFLSNRVPLTEWSSLHAYKTSAILGAGNVHYGNVTAEVRAVNSESMTSAVLSGAVKVDDSRPVLTGKEAEGTLVNGELYLNWTGVFDTTRDVTYSVYAGTDEDYGDVANQVVTKHTTYRGPCDLAVDRLYLLVQAVYTNGLNELYKAVIEL